ncbi:MAG TPA: TadE family protein [Aliidongia sp.]|nr:TadE family protein [Aliidongia sp.]
MKSTLGSKRFRGRLGERGTAAIEFAFAAPVFLLVILGIFELSFMVFVQTVLDGSARDAARLIRTGQVATSTDPQATFQNLLCSDMAVLVGCTNLIFNVQTFSSFSAVTTTPPKDKNGKPVTTFNAGNASTDMLVEVLYNRPFATQIIGKFFGSTESVYLSSTVIFRNEPYQGPTS